MVKAMKKMMETTITSLKIGHLFAKGIDYRTLSLYMLRINSLHDREAILYEAARCLQELLNYELFGFVIKDGRRIDMWVDPRIYTDHFMKAVEEEFSCRNSDCNLHYFDTPLTDSSRLPDTIEPENLISYDVEDRSLKARLYLIPRRAMFAYHDEIVQTIVKTIEVAMRNSMVIRELESAASIDPLTGCYNRRALVKLLDHDVANAKRYGQSLSVIMMDLDHFKSINDGYGHNTGDMVLRETAALVQSSIRKGDYLARYGGEEFLIVLPNTPLKEATDLAWRLRGALEKMHIPTAKGDITVTASLGVADLASVRCKDELLTRADAMLYRAKEQGRNTVAAYMPDDRPLLALTA